MPSPRRTGATAVVLGWGAAGGLAAVTLTRLWPTSSVPVLIAMEGVAGWALLAAYPLAGLALWTRRTALCLAAAGLVAVQLSLAAGATARVGPQAIPDGQLRLRLVTANVLYDNPDLRRLGDDIAAQSADVVVLQEVTPEGLSVLRTSALWAAYPYRSAAPGPLWSGIATFSRYPIASARPVDLGGHPMLLTDLDTPAGTVRVVNVHTMAPLNRKDARTWTSQFAALRRLVSDSPFPTVLAGDFNATMDHTPLGNLVSDDVRDAFQVAGTGLGCTWPSWSGPVPPLMRLDHVLVAGGVSVGSLTDHPSVGSDHRRLLAELGVPARAPTGDRHTEGVAAPAAGDGSNR